MAMFLSFSTITARRRKMKKAPEVLLAGVITNAPTIVCKNEEVAMLIQSWIHTNVTHRPPVMVAEEWPDDAGYDAVTVTPLHVLGTTEKPDFSMKAVPNLSPRAGVVLNAMIRIAATGDQPGVRNTAAAVYGNDGLGSKRQVINCIGELEKAGLIARVYERGPWKLLFGRWRPDAAAARAAGIEIEDRKERER